MIEPRRGIRKFTRDQVSRILSAAAAGQLKSGGSPYAWYCVNQAAYGGYLDDVECYNFDPYVAVMFDDWARLQVEITPDSVLAWLEEQGLA